MNEPDVPSLDRPIAHRKLWQQPLAWVAFGALFCVSCCAWTILDIPGFVTGRTDILGNYVDEVEEEEKRENLTPRERLHAESFPDWTIAEANRWDNAEERWLAFHGAIQDPKLKEAAVDLKALLRSENLTERAGELTPLLERWNRRHEELGEPFFVTGSPVSLRGGPGVLFEFYAILARVEVEIGGDAFPTLVLQRIDKTNIQESYFGRTSPDSDRAIVVVDRVVDFALDHVWLPLAYDFEANPPDNASGTDIAFHAALMKEMEAELGADALATLRKTAKYRRQIFETMVQVGERQSCGSTLQFSPYLAWDGLRPRTLDRLDAYAEADKIQPCPRMKFEEADRLREASEALRNHPELEDALERLIAWLARGTVLHEARHLADDQRHDGLNQPLECPGCPEEMGQRPRAELSAYATSLAWTESPATTLYQDCIAVGGSRSHRIALSHLLAEMQVYCDEAPPDDLNARARRAEEAFFGRTETVRLGTYPERLPVKWW